MSKKLKVAFICTEVAGVSFYRIVQPAKYLEKNGCEVRVLGYSEKAFVRPEWEMFSHLKHGAVIQQDIYSACKWADIVVWMALHTPDSLNLFRDCRNVFKGKPFVSEFDDIVFRIPHYNIANTVYYPGSILTAISDTQIKLSDALIVTTSGLKAQYEEYGKPIHIVENAIDSSLWSVALPSSHDQRVTLGWVGGATHKEDLESIKDVIFEILSRHKNVYFKCVHGCPEFFKHKPDCSWLETNDPRYDKRIVCEKCGGYPKISWTHKFKSITKYPAWVSKQGFDIGLAPLVDNDFNRGKSNLRWLEYSAMGRPTVATNISHFTESIKHGETGFLANSNEEWVEYIERLINEPELRENMGKAARKEVKENWSPTVSGKKYMDSLKEILNAFIDKKHVSDANRGLDRRSEQHPVVSV